MWSVGQPLKMLRHVFCLLLLLLYLLPEDKSRLQFSVCLWPNTWSFLSDSKLSLCNTVSLLELQTPRLSAWMLPYSQDSSWLFFVGIWPSSELKLELSPCGHDSSLFHLYIIIVRIFFCILGVKSIPLKMWLKFCLELYSGKYRNCQILCCSCYVYAEQRQRLQWR